MSAPMDGAARFSSGRARGGPRPKVRAVLSTSNGSVSAERKRTLSKAALCLCEFQDDAGESEKLSADYYAYTHVTSQQRYSVVGAGTDGGTPLYSQRLCDATRLTYLNPVFRWCEPRRRLRSRFLSFWCPTEPVRETQSEPEPLVGATRCRRSGVLFARCCC